MALTLTLRKKIENRKKDLIDGKHGLERKITELEAMLEITKSNLYATDGAIQECDYWIAEIEKKIRGDMDDCD